MKQPQPNALSAGSGVMMLDIIWGETLLLLGVARNSHYISTAIL
jgi:hypothetical protein